MSNNEQSLDEDAVFLPVDVSSPEFLYCERERGAVEKLLSEGPEAFYSSLIKEHSGCFLSSEEVSQLPRWIQNYHFNEPQVQQENGVESISEMEDFCSSYFPCHSDLPVPDLELGWPEKFPLVEIPSVTVHISPPAEGEPSVREIIRRHLQKARQLIAIVTDGLTDGAIIGDLHGAASRGVSVYIILNQRSIQEKFLLNRLQHQNIRVRVIGGRSFGLRDGRKVVGEMKEKFLLLDLETVIHGSYSFTWTDARLHRQLITVLKGPVVDSFDREFRTLYGNSFSVPTAVSHVNCYHHQKDISAQRLQKKTSVSPEITDPPSPTADSPLDWEVLGFFTEDTSLPASPLCFHEEIGMQEMPLQNSMLAKNTAFMDGFTNNQNHSVDKRRLYESLSPVPNEVVEKSPVFLNTEPLSVEPATSERTKRIKENLSSMANKVVDNSTTFQNTEPLSVEPATSERTKRIKENLSPVPNEVLEKSTIFRNTQPLSVEPATSERTKRIKENLSPVPNEVVEKSTIFRNTETLSEEPATSERTKRMDHHPIERSKLFHGKSTNRTDNKAKAPTHRRDSLKTREPSIAEEDSRADHVMPKVENKPSSRMPIILSVQRTESYSSLSDILKNISRTSSGLLKRDSNTIHAQSMWDLSQQSTATSHDKTEVPVPRYSRTSFYTDPMTPALALMEKRNDKVKATLMPKERPRSYSHLTVDWRKPLFKKDGGTREKH